MLLGRESVVTIIPTLLPLLTFYIARKSDQIFPVTRNKWDTEYDYIVGEFEAQKIDILVN